ncbi:hypothetical protein RYH80_18410 [Halobaculum sp. MBLA0147]|uniref:hypothetical protein n=1 Tax=Halobaculum sp. MBLA0147 TaxID=3079934 RepID=UPI0035264121
MSTTTISLPPFDQTCSESCPHHGCDLTIKSHEYDSGTSRVTATISAESIDDRHSWTFAVADPETATVNPTTDPEGIPDCVTDALSVAGYTYEASDFSGITGRAHHRRVALTQLSLAMSHITDVDSRHIDRAEIVFDSARTTAEILHAIEWSCTGDIDTINTAFQQRLADEHPDGWSGLRSLAPNVYAAGLLAYIHTNADTPDSALATTDYNHDPVPEDTIIEMVNRDDIGILAHVMNEDKHYTEFI